MPPKYNKLFIIENRNLWEGCKQLCHKDTDLVLCIDFALKLELVNNNYNVLFLDHLSDRETMQRFNLQMHDFLGNWFKSSAGEDLLIYDGFNIGDALLLNMYNDVTYFCHFFFSCLAIREIDYETLHVCVEENLITKTLELLNIQFKQIEKNNQLTMPVYLFPISRWMDEKINRTSLRSKAIDTSAVIFDHVFKVYDSFFKTKKTKVYIQGYYPTSKIIGKLKENKNIRLILGNYTQAKSIYKERRVFFSKPSLNKETNELLKKFTDANKRTWEAAGYKISDYLYQIITPVLVENLNNAISKSKNIKSFFDKNIIKLMVPVTNFWLNNRLIMNYCKNNNITIFMIINGLLVVDLGDDAKDSDWVNCYSESIKREYFKNSKHAIPIGDPRMDEYVTMCKKTINRECPNIVIGAAGFDVTDLNSYLAYEFDFLYDILKVIAALREHGYKNTVTLKVRANGYANLYKSFCKEYFSGLDVRIEQNQPFKKVIETADLYITFYSQTVFEASTFGIPAIYYKKDNQFIHTPFNGNSELVTAFTTADINNRIKDFYKDDSSFNSFLNKEVMEKYIGALDGKNVQRNMEFIYSLIK
jgi:hypothetical protein